MLCTYLDLTRILQFSAYALTIFIEYTAWAAFGGVSWKWPKVTFHISISIIAYLIFLLLAIQNRYANEVLNMCIWWWQTTWVILVPITTHIPIFIIVAHTEFWVFVVCLFVCLVVFLVVISQSEQICKWDIKYVHLVTTDHMDSTCAHHYPHTKFHQCSPYRTLDIWLFLLLANQNRYAKWGIKYVHLVTTDHMGSTFAYHYPHTMFHQCSPYRTLDIWLFCY